MTLRAKSSWLAPSTVHSHIAGGNVNTARLLLPEQQAVYRAHAGTPGPGPAGWTSWDTGCRYAQMGYTTVIEPAMLPANALSAHLELATIPIIDTGALAVLGSDDFLLSRLRDGAGAEELRDYVAWVVEASRALGVKVINAGGAAAFKYNARSFDIDDEVPAYGVTSRRITTSLQRAVEDAGVPHPLHVHCNNLGIPGNAGTAIDTMSAAEGQPMHFAHIQFYAYGKDGKRGFSSASSRIVEGHGGPSERHGGCGAGAVWSNSDDLMRCFAPVQFFKCGAPAQMGLFKMAMPAAVELFPTNTPAASFANAVQWAVGLEVVLAAPDLWRVIFSTDHPNGAPFTRYPEIVHLLMDRDERARWLERLPASARRHSLLTSMERELSFNDIAIITRAGPATHDWYA